MWDELFDELRDRFGFSSVPRSLSRTPKLPKVAAAAKRKAAAIEAVKDFILICQEDIFQPGHRRKPILLLSKGQEISAKDLPKLILHGVQPEQFRFKAEENAETVMTAEEIPANANPAESQNTGVDAENGSMAWRPMGNRRTQNVVLLESDPKMLKRLIDCLFVCGFDLNRIHPVGMAANLEWALRRYEPEVLIGDAGLLSAGLNSDSLALLPQQLIITLAGPPGDQPTVQVTLANGMVAQCLYKPVTRFSLRQLLTQAEQGSVPSTSEQKPNIRLTPPRRAMLRMG